jgi:hypothetical protein
MRRVAAGTSRNVGILFLLKPLAVHRRVVFGDLIDAQRRIVAPHESCIRVALAADIDDLAGARLADVAFLSIHRLQAHDTRVAAVTRRAAKAFGGMDIVFVKFRRLREMRDAKDEMTRRAVVFGIFRLRRAGAVRPANQ